jgi:hypothetical protein
MILIVFRRKEQICSLGERLAASQGISIIMNLVLHMRN